MENKEKDKSIDERVHQQLVYKDKRIIDLNNTILDKEKQILDLQERVRAHNEVATVKNQAMRIVQQKFEEMHRDKKDMSTETEPGMMGFSSQGSGNGPSTSGIGGRSERRARSSSPGHVIAARKSIGTSGTFSPPPIDPPEASASSHSKLGPNLPDIDGISRKHHQRKRVTFDLNPGAYRHPHNDSLESALTEASSENALLRQQVFDLNAAVEKMKSDYEAEIVKCTKEGKTAGLKARVAATARIRELETSLESFTRENDDETGRLKEEVETLRSSRNWEIEQNGQLREQVAHLKEKTHKLTEELDVSEKAKRGLDTEVEESKKLMELMVDDLLQAENTIMHLLKQKESIFEDIDRLKEAIVAQDRFIEILEADIVIYEQHIGLLRENLGASKVDHRALIKSKAFETKLLALEREKEQIDKKSNEDRLKTKALDKKCRVLVEQNEHLMARLCELEMLNTGADESQQRRLSEQDERIRQISSALESERDVSQRLREAKEALERELQAKSRQEEVSNNRHAMDVEMSRMEADNRVDEMTVEVNAARKKVTDVLAEVEQLRATNFDLQMHIETAKRTMEELANSNEELEDRVREIEEANEEKEDDLKQSTWDVETLTRQNEALRVELDGIRQGFQDTRELAEEVKQLKAELARQQDLHRAQFEAACQQIDQEEEAQRKTSLEVQQEQYILAFEEKVQELNDELEHTKAQREHFQRLLDQSEKEIQKLKDNAVPVQRKTTAMLEAPNLENLEEMQKVQEVQMVQAPPPPAASEAFAELKLQNAQLLDRLQRVEMEANLSGELNIELGRAMLELEEQNELLKREQDAVAADEVASGRELELHVMMVNEMTEQIAAMQARIEEMERSKEGQATEIQRLLHNLGEFEIARREDLEKAGLEHHEEVQRLLGRLEDSKKQVKDLEEKLEVSEQRILQAPVQQEEPVVLQETVILQSSTPVFDAPEDIREQNRLYRECHDDVSQFQNMQKLIELKDELEIAVQALKAEIWTLNGQLKASILDREGLEDKVAELDSLVEKEKKRAISLDVELQEQVDLTERAVRRAAEAENESNQRMAECLEKETRREEIEKAYTRLNEYYTQLQEAYNNVYAQLSEAQTSSEASSSSAPNLNPTLSAIIDGIMTILLIVNDSSISLSTQQKLEKVADKLKALLAEYDENLKALEEQRRISEALEQRLATLEQASGFPDQATTTRERVEQLEGEIEWKEEECEALKRRIRELEKALEAVAERADESEAAAVSRLSTELAILAARLTTRQADVDSLFRTNAELAHTNVRLQNEVDEVEEWKSKMEEEKQQLEQHVKELEEQVAELLQQHEASLQENSGELQKTQEEVQRLTSIEKILNNRILALEDVNMELEEKVQEIEEELSTIKTSAANTEKPSTSDWDSWGATESEKAPIDSEKDQKLQEAKDEVERLTDVERALTMQMEALQMQNEQLESMVKVQENVQKTSAVDKEEDWGWGEEKAPETSASTEQEEDWGWGEETSEPAAKNDSELFNAKTEVQRLSEVEKILNNRILALEDQNLELEERLQEMEDELVEEKKKQRTDEGKKETEEDWGWGDEEQKDSDLQKTISELQQKLQFQKEVIEKAEVELSEQQDRYDELLEQTQESDAMKYELERSKSRVESVKAERDEALEKLERMKQEKELLEAKVKELKEDLAAKQEELRVLRHRYEGRNENAGVAELQRTITELQGRLEHYKDELDRTSDELNNQYDMVDEAKNNLEDVQADLKEMSKRFDEVKDQLEAVEEERDSMREKLVEAEKEKEQLEVTIRELKETQKEDNGWDDDGWGEEEKKEDPNLSTLTQKIQDLETIIEDQKDEAEIMTQRLSQFESEALTVQQQLKASNQELEDVKKLLTLKEAELEVAKVAAAADSWGDDDGWNEKDNEEVEGLREAQRTLEVKVEALEQELTSVKQQKEELIKSNDMLQGTLKSVKDELEETKRKLAEANEAKEASESSGWNDEGWNNDVEDETKAALEVELAKSQSLVEMLQEQINHLEQESADLSAELEQVKHELRVVLEQNGLLKDSEARLIDHADEFAIQADKEKEKCVKLTARIAELEGQLQKVQKEDGQKQQQQQQLKQSSDELVTLRQQLANAEQELRSRNAAISDREGLIAELRRQVSEQQKNIEELHLKLKSLVRRQTRPSISSTSSRMDSRVAHQESRPSSQMSTSSRISTATSSSFVPEPIQSYGSAFDAVVPQSGEPLRRRNK